MRPFVVLALAGVLLGLCQPPAYAAPPSLTVPATVSGVPGGFITVPATTDAKGVKWVVLDAGLHLFPASLLKDTKTAVCTAPQPGTYRLLAYTGAADELSEPAICSVVVAGTPPAPTPTPPTPTPPPGPTPAPAGSKVAWAVVVLDNSHRTVQVGQLLGSVTLRAALDARGISSRVLDVSDPMVASHHYDALVQAAGGEPVLILLDAQGRKVNALHLPGDETSFLAALPAPPAQIGSACGPNGCPVHPYGMYIFQEYR